MKRLVFLSDLPPIGLGGLASMGLSLVWISGAASGEPWPGVAVFLVGAALFFRGLMLRRRYRKARDMMDEPGRAAKP